MLHTDTENINAKFYRIQHSELTVKHAVSDGSARGVRVRRAGVLPRQEWRTVAGSGRLLHPSQLVVVPRLDVAPMVLVEVRQAIVHVHLTLYV